MDSKKSGEDIIVNKSDLIERLINCQSQITSWTENYEKKMAKSSINQLLVEIKSDEIINLNLYNTLVKELEIYINKINEEIKFLERQRGKVGNKAITKEILDCLIVNAGSEVLRLQDLRRAQFRLIYTLAFCVQTNINALRFFTKKNLLELIEEGKTIVLFNKGYDRKRSNNEFEFQFESQREYRITEYHQQLLKQRLTEIEVVFDQYQLNYLGSTFKYPNKIGYKKVFIDNLNKDIENTVKKYKLGNSGEFKSSSFKIIK